MRVSPSSTLVFSVALAVAALSALSPADAKESKKRSYVGKPAHPGLVHARRLVTREERTVRVVGHGHVKPEGAKEFTELMRAPTGEHHSIDRRLLAQVAQVSDHFAGRTIEIISGYRPFTTKQYNPHSNHNHGRAIDFRVVGVPNEVVRDYCRTLPNTGCGYYPNSVFVHMDVRATSAYWIDYSKPGEAPRYHKPGANADEGTSDVPGEADAPAPPPSAPSDPGAAPAPAASAP